MGQNFALKARAGIRARTIGYWIATAIIVLETAVGADWDLTRNAFVSQVFHHLGYPLYVLTIIGIWKVLAVAALLAPGFPRLKEWAYAGVFFVYSGAAASHLAMGDVAAAWGPICFCGLCLASWALRPANRRLSVYEKNGEATPVKKSRRIAYWCTIAVLEFALLSAGITELIHFSGNVQGIVQQLGYPLYFLTIQGMWKILACIAIAVPGFPRLKEWAYAGIFFSMTGAAASNAICGLGAAHILPPLLLSGIALVSWALRFGNRKISAIQMH